MNKTRFAVAATALLTFSLGISPVALAQYAGPQQLATTANGWSGAPFGTSKPIVEKVGGIVQLRGAISTTGTNLQPFVLAGKFRPTTDVYVPVDLCNSANGRIHITPSGVADIEYEGSNLTAAQCFTSLDGVSFAPSANGFTELTLINGWINAPFATSNAAVRKINGIVHLKGAIATSGTNMLPFVLPAGFRPATDVYVHLDLCNSTNGRIHITPSGVADIEVEAGNFAAAECFTSLDGAWFSTATGATPLTLINGWINGPFSTGAAAVVGQYGIVYFQGGIATSGTNMEPFVLPVAFRPVTNVYVPIDLCNATKGRLVIQTSGDVTVQPENGTLANAQCFTSLEGASFVQ
jgi:hypothetical protein